MLPLAVGQRALRALPLRVPARLVRPEQAVAVVVIPMLCRAAGPQELAGLVDRARTIPPMSHPIMAGQPAQAAAVAAAVAVAVLWEMVDLVG